MVTSQGIDRLLDRRWDCLPLIQKLEKVFAEMDRVYRQTARSYGFVCSGCEDNCCKTHFYHHTLLEYLFLHEGFHQCDPSLQKRLQNAARQVVDPLEAARKAESDLRRMCPLNQKGRCLLYAYRPMICRLHGIPYELHRPGGAIVYGPGCDAFGKITPRGRYLRFDRTPFYQSLADLEGQVRRRFKLNARIKMTVAEMVRSFSPIRR